MRQGMATGYICCQWTDADEQLSSQAARTRCKIPQATLDSFNGRIAKYRPNEIAVARPVEFCRCLVSVVRAWSDTAQRIGNTVFRLKCADHSAKSGRIDAMSLPFKLDPLQASGSFVDLEKGDQGDAANDHIAQHDLRVAIAEIERALKHYGTFSKMRNQCALCLAPPDAL